MVVDLGDGADRRARVARRALLVDRDGRRQAVDLVDVRLLHLAEELAGVGAQALDVAALALGVDRVEGEARLAAPGQAGDDDQPVARERDVDVLEVVFARAAHDESILGHVTSVADAVETERAFSARPGTPGLRGLPQSPMALLRRPRGERDPMHASQRTGTDQAELSSFRVLLGVQVLATAVFGLVPLLLPTVFADITGYTGDDTIVYRLAGAATTGYLVAAIVALASRTPWVDLRIPMVATFTFTSIAALASLGTLLAGDRHWIVVVVLLAATVFAVLAAYWLRRDEGPAAPAGRALPTEFKVVVGLATLSAGVFGLMPLLAAGPFASLFGLLGTDTWMFRMAGAACFGYATSGVLSLRAEGVTSGSRSRTWRRSRSTRWPRSRRRKAVIGAGRRLAGPGRGTGGDVLRHQPDAGSRSGSRADPPPTRPASATRDPVAGRVRFADVRRDRPVPGRPVEPARLPAGRRPRARRGSRAASRRPCPRRCRPRPARRRACPTAPRRPAGPSTLVTSIAGPGREASAAAATAARPVRGAGQPATVRRVPAGALGGPSDGDRGVLLEHPQPDLLDLVAEGRRALELELLGGRLHLGLHPGDERLDLGRSASLNSPFRSEA